jgi:hypothetical protein
MCIGVVAVVRIEEVPVWFTFCRQSSHCADDLPKAAELLDSFRNKRV